MMHVWWLRSLQLKAMHKQHLLNSDLESLLNYGKSWLLEFEVKKTKALTVSRKQDPNKNLPLVMDGIPITERKTLKILGYTFDSIGLWSAHIEQTVKEAHQRLGAINHYLKDTKPLCIQI